MNDAKLNTLMELIASALELGKIAKSIEMGNLTSSISQAEAYRLYGRKQVDLWGESGFIMKIKDKGAKNTKVRYDRLTIIVVDKVIEIYDKIILLSAVQYEEKEE